VARALDRDRDRRFASAAEMGAALQSFLNTYNEAAGPRQVAGFLVDLFGKEAARSKTDIPTLSRLDLAAVVATPTASPRLPIDTPPTPAPRVGGTPPPVVSGPAAPTQRRWLPFAVMGLVAVPAVALGVHLARGRAPEQVVRVVAQPAVPVAAPDAAPPVVAAPVNPPPARAEDLPTKTPRVPRPPRPPARLDEKSLKAVVARAQPRLVACFKRHAADLPGETGQVKIELGVAGTGMVTSAGVHLPGFSSAALASCLEDEALRMRFPPHADHEIRFAFPLLYRRGN
jgi:serine/threonine-protein kinase